MLIKWVCLDAGTWYPSGPDSPHFGSSGLTAAQLLDPHVVLRSREWVGEGGAEEEKTVKAAMRCNLESKHIIRNEIVKLKRI